MEMRLGVVNWDDRSGLRNLPDELRESKIVKARKSFVSSFARSLSPHLSRKLLCLPDLTGVQTGLFLYLAEPRTPFG